MWEPIETAPSIGPGISWLPKDTGRETWSRDPVPLGCNRCLLAANNVDANTGRGGERAHWQPRDARRPAPGGFRSTVDASWRANDGSEIVGRGRNSGAEEATFPR